MSTRNVFILVAAVSYSMGLLLGRNPLLMTLAGMIVLPAILNFVKKIMRP